MKLIKKAFDNLIPWDKNCDRIVKFKYIFFIVCLYLFIFQFALQEYIPWLKYWDEVYAILFFPLILIKILKNKFKKQKIRIQKEDEIILLAVILLILIGIIANITFQYQKNFIAFQEILIVFKFLLAFYTTKLIFEDIKIYQNEKLANHTKIITVSLFFFFILD